MKEKLITLLTNSSFEDLDGNIYEFNTFPNSQNITINGKLIGDYRIKEDGMQLKIDFEGSYYEVIEIWNNSLVLKQSNTIFEMKKRI